MSDRFVYVTYIRTTPEELFEALINPDFTRRFWSGISQESEWKPGSAWAIKFSDGRIADAGEVVEFDPPRRIVLKWRNEFRPDLKAEGYSRCVMEIEPAGATVKLTITHSMERDGSKFVEAVSGGWPMILSSLKSLLETGAALEEGKT
jgi:uncharacterized protein YndB with AHSA1/START domain